MASKVNVADQSMLLEPIILGFGKLLLLCLLNL